MKYLVFLIKRLVMSLCMLYAVDLIITSAGLIVPINAISIISVAILGLPAIIGIVIMQKIM